MKPESRRKFLKRLLLASNEASSNDARHCLVRVFLRGGADTLNMIVPYGDDDYYKFRPTLAIGKPDRQATNKSCLKLTDFYGLHPMLAPLMDSFRDGRLAIIQSVGTDNTSGSHFDAQDQMEHGEGYRQSGHGGWLGRHLLSMSRHCSPLTAVAIGSSIPESLRAAPSASALRSVDDVRLKAPGNSYEHARKALEQLYAAEVDLLSQAGKDTLGLMKRVEGIRERKYSPLCGVNYPDSDFGSGLREIAKLIKADLGLEVACIDLEGWDTHYVQGSYEGLQASIIKQLGEGMAAFDKDLGVHRQRVTVLVLTEFGRRTYENSSLGTDHGRGFAAMVLSDRAKGGQVIGPWLGLKEEQGAYLLGPGGLNVAFDYRSVLFEVLRDLVGNRNAEQVFPNYLPTLIGLT